MELGDFTFGNLKVEPTSQDEFGRFYVGEEIIVSCDFVQDRDGKKLTPFDFPTIFEEGADKKDKFGVFVYKHENAQNMIWNKGDKKWEIIQLNQYLDIEQYDFLEVMEYDKESNGWQAKVMLMAEPPDKDNGEEIYRYRESGPIDQPSPRSPLYFFRFYFERKVNGHVYKGLSKPTEYIEIASIESIFKAAVWTDNYLNPTYIEMFLRNEKKHEGFLRFDNTEGPNRRVGIALEGQDGDKKPLNRMTFDTYNNKGEIKIAGNLDKADEKTMFQMNSNGDIEIFTLLENSEYPPYLGNKVIITRNSNDELTLNLSNKGAPQKGIITIKDDGTIEFNGEGNIILNVDVEIRGKLNNRTVRKHPYDTLSDYI